MKLALAIFFSITFFIVPSPGNSQINYSFEFEAAPVLSNRLLNRPSENDGWLVNEYRSQSKMIPGLYAQFGVNFRKNKSTRLYTGLRILNQQVMVSSFHIYDISIDPNGNWVASGSPVSKKTDLVYLQLPFSVKQNMISKPGFSLVSEIGIVPGLLIGGFPSGGLHTERLALSAEYALSFEWKLKNGNMAGLKFPAINCSLLSNKNIYKDINQYNYSLGLGFKLGLGNSENGSDKKAEHEENEKYFSFEAEIASHFTNNRIRFNEKYFENFNPDNYDYLWSKYEFEEFSKAESGFLPGVYLQVGVNLRENKKTRFFAGIRIFEQGVMATAHSSELVFNPGNSTYELTTKYEFEKIRMRYLSVPLSIKQTVIQNADFRFGFEFGIAPGILIHDSSDPQYSQGEFTALPVEASLSFEKKLKGGNWIGLKFPSCSYSLFPNTLRNNILQYNYSIGAGLKMTLPH